ncbi:MAG TPA: peptidoglycan DD-metalloendopeptidase family protein [Thermomicrobiaceae bacterium]|nr:peptidoglycan DD-metalloendopeptidase family protein [Thermomicrobiaceae bacterium]
MPEEADRGRADPITRATAWLRRTSVVPYWLLITLAFGAGGTVGVLGIAATSARRQAAVVTTSVPTTLPRTSTLPAAPKTDHTAGDAAVGQIQSLSSQVSSLAADLEQAQHDAAALNNQTQQQSQTVAQTQAALQSSQQQVQATDQQLQAVQQQRQSEVQDLNSRVQSLDQRISQLEQLASQLRGMLGLPAAQVPVGGPTASDLAGTANAQAVGDQISQDMNRLAALQTSLDQVNQTAQEQFAAAQQAAANVPTGALSLSTTPRGAPVNGVVTQSFGPTSFTSEPAYGPYPHFHSGIDLAVPTGTPVKATAAGTVVVAGWDGGYGNLVEIDHGNGIETFYGHNTQVLVTVGQQVKAGQVISISGSTGNSTGPHVHYEIRINSVPVDPTPFIALGP